MLLVYRFNQNKPSKYQEMTTFNGGCLKGELDNMFIRDAELQDSPKRHALDLISVIKVKG